MFLCDNDDVCQILLPRVSSTREHERLTALGHVTVHELRSIQDANRAGFAVWEAVPGAAEIAFDAAERVAGAGTTAARTSVEANVEALELALRIVRELSGMSEGEGELDTKSAEECPDPYVDVIRQLVAMLAALPSIHGAISGRRRIHEEEGEEDADRQQEPQSPGTSCHQFPSVNPYVGYRSDIIGALANMVYRRRTLQDAVRLCTVHGGGDGLCVVLSHCAPDEGAEVPAAEGRVGTDASVSSTGGNDGATERKGNPFLREWALFCVRNLTENNLENQDAIRKLEVQEAASNKTMDNLGLRVDIDAATHRPIVVSAAATPPPSS